MKEDALVRVERLTLDDAERSLAAALERVLASRRDPVRSIAIKINLCEYRRAESGATTHPAILASLLEVLGARFPGARVRIVENDATSMEMESAFRLLGIERVAREHGAELHNVAEGAWITRDVPHGIVLKQLEVPAALEECDLFINFAKLKTNALTKMTGCLKNIFGLLRMKRKVVLHGQIDEVLLDMNRVIRPDLCLVDGYIGMEGMGGPAYGAPKRCELLIAGRNPVAVDACCARIMGFSPLSVRHIKLCHRAGLGPVAYHLETEIARFDYRAYRFRFDHGEYWLRNLLRRRAGFAT